MTNTFFDIETGPLPPEQLRDVEPEFKAPSNYKDELKIAAAIAEQREKWIERAALSPLTGRILAIGYATDDGRPVINCDASEENMIVDFFACVRAANGGTGHLVGFNIFDFDLPFIVRRAWILGIRVPDCMMPAPRYWPGYLFTDLRALWQLGDRQAEGSLDVLARAMGIGRKSGSGAKFAEMLAGSELERVEALAYLSNDIELTRALWRRLTPKPIAQGATS